MGLKRVGILLVHGMGEQKWFQTLDQIATNFYQALKDQYGANACRQVLVKEEALYLADEAVWREAPVRLRWRQKNDEYEAIFREVYWADLDEPENGLRFLRFVFWGLTVAAAKKYEQSKTLRPPSAYGMRPPTATGWLEGIRVRIELFVVSMTFLILLLSVGVIHWIIRRVLQIGVLGRVMRILYDYLGDIKLYQDEYLRRDRIETVGERSRVTIRTRMVAALARMALDSQIDEYYIVAHSLGTVVAFNGLMETGAALPNYLTQEMWEAVRAAGLNEQLSQPVGSPQMPERPLWLGPRDGINRSKFFAKLKGFLTLGSPLDKFAAVWPRTVPINCEPIPRGIEWHNVADAQDIVGAELDLFGDDRRDCPDGNPAFSPSAPFMVGGLSLHNHTWADQLWFFKAHTSYWTAETGKDRLVNRCLEWVEGKVFQSPSNRIPPPIARVVLFPTQLVAVFVLLVFILSCFLAWSPLHLSLFLAAITVFVGSFIIVGALTFGRWLIEKMFTG